MYRDGARADQQFAEQFEPDGDGWIYRRSRKGAAIKVSASERDRFVSEFGSHRRGSEWIVYAGAGLLISAMVVVAISRPDISLNSVTLLIAIGAAAIVLSIPYALRLRWLRAAPARALRTRVPIGPARTRKEMRQLRLAKLTYGRLGLAALCALYLAVPRIRREQLYPGWNRFAVTVAAMLFAVIAIQLFRKWRFDRERRDR